jgi:hypothetical protein
MNLITTAEADTSQENNWHTETFTSGLSVIRPESMASAEITSYKPTSNEAALRRTLRVRRTGQWLLVG